MALDKKMCLLLLLLLGEEKINFSQGEDRPTEPQQVQQEQKDIDTYTKHLNIYVDN